MQVDEDIDRMPISALRTPVGEPAKKLTSWTKEPELSVLKQDVEASRPTQKEQITKITRWLDNLHMTGGAKLTARKGRSGVQPKLIRKQAEWRYTALSEPFLASDKLFSVNPVSYEDQPAAVQNELLLNWQFRTKLNPVFLIDQYVRTCVNEGTVAVRVGWERETKKVKIMAPVYSYYLMSKPEQVEALSQAMALEMSNPGEYSKLPEALKESVRYSMEAGHPHLAEQTGEEEVEETQVIKNEPTVEVININNLIIDSTCGGDPDKAMFMAYSYETTWGALKRDKRYKNLDAVGIHSSGILAEPDHVTSGPMEVNFKDQARKKVVLHEYYGYFDIEGKHHLTPILVCWVGSVMVRCEINPFPDGKPPFVIVPYMPLPRSCYGEPDGELLEDNQKIEGAITRGIIDLMARSANGQRGMAKNMLDTTNRRRFENGDDYEFNPNAPPAMSIFEHKFPEIPQTAMAMLGIQSQQAESLTGVKTFNDGVTGASLGPTAAGVRSAVAASTVREMGILRRLAKGMAIVGGKVVAMNQEFLSEKEVVRITNTIFVTVQRDQLHGNFDFDVVISTPEEDNAKANDLSFMLQTLGPNLDLEMTKLIMTEIARLRRMPALAHKIQNFQPQPDPLDVAKKNLEIQELQGKVQVLAAKAQEHMGNANLDNAKAGLASSERDQANLDFVEQETGTKHARDLDRIGQQAESNQKLAITKGILDQRPLGADLKESVIPDAPTAESIAQAFAFGEVTKQGG